MRHVDGLEWDRLRGLLAEAGVRGAEDLGTFVSNTASLDPSRFDERAATSVLISELPDLRDPTLVRAVAGHLARPWARPSAFEALAGAFRQWALVD